MGQSCAMSNDNQILLQDLLNLFLLIMLIVQNMIKNKNVNIVPGIIT